MFSFVPSSRHWTCHLTHAAIAALLLLAGPARAGDEKCLVGTWTGTLEEKKDDEIVFTPVKVTVLPTLDMFPEDSTSSGGKGLPPQSQQYIRFGPPMACRLDLFFSGTHSDKDPAKGLHYHLTMTNPTGGACNKLEDLQLRLACLPDGQGLRAWYRGAKESADKKLDLARASK